MDNVFDVFEESPYQFLKVKRGTTYGNEIVGTYDAMGIFKRRNEEIQVNNQERRQSAASLHIHPDESFIANVTRNGRIEFVGHGIRVGGVDYEIIADSGGYNFDEGVMEHYTLKLQNAEFVDPSEES